MPRYRCSKCNAKKDRGGFHEARGGDRKRPVASQCRACRSEERFKRLYPNSVCIQCLGHRPLDRNRICSTCNEETGLRQCRGPCGEILPLFLKFELKRLHCRDCWAELRRARRLVGRRRR